MKLIEELNKLGNDDLAVINKIKEVLMGEAENSQIISLYNEGHFYIRGKQPDYDEPNSDIYFKLVLIQKGSDVSIIDNTGYAWVVENLSMSPGEHGALNLIVHKKYDGIYKYALNPNIGLDTSINPEQYGICLNESYDDSTNVCRNIINGVEDSHTTEVYVHRNIFRAIDNDYDVAVDIEYRTSCTDMHKKCSNNKDTRIKSFVDKHGYFIDATVVISGLIEKIQENFRKKLKVLDFKHNFDILPFNTHNLNDDIEIRVGVFKLEILDTMIEHGYTIIGGSTYYNGRGLSYLDIYILGGCVLITEAGINELDDLLIPELYKMRANLKTFRNSNWSELVNPDTLYAICTREHLHPEGYIQLYSKIAKIEDMMEIMHQAKINLVYNHNWKEDLAGICRILNINYTVTGDNSYTNFNDQCRLIAMLVK